MLEQKSIPAVLDVAAAAKVLRERPDITLIDVRTPEEFAAAHIPNSTNIPLDRIFQGPQTVAAGIHGSAILVCRTSNRAHLAREVLQTTGMKELHVLDGGVVAWGRAGRDLVRGGRN